MPEMLKQLAGLSPEKRRLLELLLKEQGVDLSRSVIVPQKRESNAFPLSFAQQRLWFQDQLEPGSSIYNIPMAVRLAGPLDVTALERALNEIVRRHESLRTTFAMVNGKPAQVVAPQLTLSYPVEDLTNLSTSEREAEALRLASEEAQRPFDLAHGPLLRARLLRLHKQEHLVLLTMHHIITDGWSMGVFVSEMAALYSAFSAGSPSPLPELTIQYADYAAWQQEWLKGQVLEEQLAYWKQQLSGSPPVLELPTDRPRPAVQSYRGASHSFTLSRRLLTSLLALSQQEEVTLFMTLLAAFQTLLSRYTGQEDICVGTPIANRNRAETEELIGFFVNTLVLRGDLAGDPSFRELLKRTREVTLGAYAHQDLPFEMLVDALRPQRDMSHTPLFQVMFALQNVQNALDKPLQLPSLELTPVEIESGLAIFDLTLTMAEGPVGSSGVFEYNMDLFDAATITRMMGHFQTLLEGIAANPDRPLSALPLLTESERHQLVVEWNTTTADYPASQCVHQLFEVQVQSSPDVIAVVLPAMDSRGTECLTYRDLNRRANQLAHHLRGFGVGPETLVGICVERSLEMVVGLLGILKAGGAYLPLDPSYPSDRLAFMLRDSQSPVLLTRSHLMESISHLLLPASCNIVCLDTDWPIIAQQSDEDPTSGVTPENLAYVIYTSGSTGQPKGVAVQHRSVVNHNVATARAFDLQPVDRVLQFATINFDTAVEELYPTWLSGARVVLRPEELLTGQELEGLIEREGLTVLDLPTAYWHEWVYERSLSGAPLPACLRLVIVGGEKVSAERFVQWQQVGGASIAWMNTYGPTEATVIATLYEPVPGEAVGGEVSIGRPIANAQVYLLDRHLQPVPVGVPGELYIGGVGVARGYLNRPELTTEKFIPDPFRTDVQSARFYKTGDLARFRPDGNIEFMGRVDEQVKVRGFRVELGEIEAVLSQHPALREVAVLAWASPAQADKRLVAYVVPAQGPAPTVDEMRSWLKGRLPKYMLPSTFVVLAALPKLPNGKVNRRALPALDGAHLEWATSYVAPRTPVEEILAGIWAQVLGVNQVGRQSQMGTQSAIGVHDNFFELGGHSLLATQLISRVRETFQMELPLRSLFEAPTVAGLAQSIETSRRATAGLLAPAIQPVPRDGDLPLSFGQQRLWFLDQLEPDSPLYNLPDVVRLTGPLDVTALAKSLNEIVRRHEVLRTTFPTVDGQAVQAIAPQLILTVPVIDLRHLPQVEQETEIQWLSAQEAQRPFDLAQGPLLRASLLRLNEQEHVALFTMHHIVFDGWSAQVFIEEIAALYRAYSVRGTPEGDLGPSPLPPLPIQYADFAHWQRQWLQGAVLETQLAYWKQQLADSPPMLELPTDRPRPPVQTSRGAHQPFELFASLSESLRALSRREGVTLFMTLLAAFQTLLHRYTGQDDISVGTPIANRNRAEIEGLLGFFVNTLVMRTDLSGDPSFRDLLKRVRETALGAYAHQDIPFEMIVDALQPVRDMSHSPLFQVMFALQNVPTKELALSSLTLSQLDVDTGVTNFDLTLAIEETPTGLAGAIRYNTDLFDASTIVRLIRQFQTLLESIVADPDQSIATLPLLAETELRQLLVEWNGTWADYPTDQCVHQLFEAQVKRTPNAIAVQFESEQLTYVDLNHRANQLAHRLQGLGVGPETLVGICAERSLEMVVGVLGVLKAGGAYVPLDPTYPPERLGFMLEDTQAPVLLTQARWATELTTLPVAGKTHIVHLDTDWPGITQESTENVNSEVTGANLAYVIYTSGSTGKPKGVQIEHRRLLNLVFWHQHAFAISPLDRATLIAGPGFDASVWEIWPYLTAGASLHIPNDGTRALPTQLRDWLVSQAITISFVPTPLAENLLASDWPANSALRILLTGGDKLHSSPRPMSFALMNNYGPTEYTVVTTSGLVAPGERADRAPSIGQPIANTQVYILDRHLQPVPVGVSGELHVGGAGLARGYLNHPDLTAEKFIPDPFRRDMPSACLYKTGDLARYLPDGNIEFLGRIDHQVKIRGFRIELGEIEAVLSQYPALRDVVVMAREDGPGNKRLVAYLVPDREPAPNVGELRDFMRDKLPEYMLPSAFVVLDALPLTPNGKVDRRALPKPEQMRPELDSAYVAPRTPAEEVLAGIWAKALGVKQVGIYDNFFELGGDSILSIQVITRANQAGLQLTPKQLFQSPTIAGLAAVAGTTQPIHAEQGLVQGPTPLTPIQRWFFEQDFPVPHRWNQAALLQVQQPLEPSVLKASIEHLLAHHDALRLRFKREASGWQATNAGVEGPVPFEWIDLAVLSRVKQEQAIETRATELQASLNLFEGPLMRVAYFDLGVGQPGRLLIIVHHLVMDGVSWRVLLEDLLMVYQQLSGGEVVQLPPKTTSFQHWALRLTEYAQSEAARQELSHWLQISAGGSATTPFPIERLSVDFPQNRAVDTEANTRSAVVSLQEAETQALLRQVPEAYHTEINDVLLTALAQTFAWWTGSRTLLVDLEGHGREDILPHVDISRTIGWFTAVYPVLLNLGETTRPGESLRAIKEQLRQIPRHGIGYGVLRYLCQDPQVVEQMRALPQAEMSFNYLGQVDQALSGSTPFALASESIGPAHSPLGKPSHLLDINGGIIGGRLRIEWTYSGGLYKPATIEQLAHAYVDALRSLIAHCQSVEASSHTPADFPLVQLDQRQLDKVLVKIGRSKEKVM